MVQDSLPAPQGEEAGGETRNQSAESRSQGPRRTGPREQPVPMGEPAQLISSETPFVRRQEAHALPVGPRHTLLPPVPQVGWLARGPRAGVGSALRDEQNQPSLWSLAPPTQTPFPGLSSALQGTKDGWLLHLEPQRHSVT